MAGRGHALSLLFVRCHGVGTPSRTHLSPHTDGERHEMEPSIRERSDGEATVARDGLEIGPAGGGSTSTDRKYLTGAR